MIWQVMLAFEKSIIKKEIKIMLGLASFHNKIHLKKKRGWIGWIQYYLTCKAQEKTQPRME